MKQLLTILALTLLSYDAALASSTPILGYNFVKTGFTGGGLLPGGGGILSGMFTGIDDNADGSLQVSELISFSARFEKDVAPLTASFSLDGVSEFEFSIGANQFQSLFIADRQRQVYSSSRIRSEVMLDGYRLHTTVWDGQWHSL